MPIILDDVRFLQSQTDNSAKALRREYEENGPGVGVAGRNDFDVTFSAGLTVNVAAGTAWLRGQSTAKQGMYRAYQGTAGTVTLTAAHATLPRLDQIVLIVQDSSEDGGANNRAIVDVVTGTATSGATLDNRSGAANLATQPSPTIIRLADVLVNANNSPALSGTNIRDRRPYGIRGVTPALKTDIDIVGFMPTPGVVQSIRALNGTAHANCQSAALFYLPRSIAATRIRWRYQQDHTTPVGTGQSYRFAICDASGRYECLSALTSFQAGADNAFAEVITFTLNPELPSGYVFEQGNHYVFFGVSGLTTTQSCAYLAVDSDTAAYGHTPAWHNQFLALTSGGTTFPSDNTILSLGDQAGLAAPTVARLPVPVCALSVG